MALATLFMAVMAVLVGTPADAVPYPPPEPGATETTVSTPSPSVSATGARTDETAVAGTRAGNDGTRVLGVKVGDVLGSRLAATGTDALPYAAGGAILLLGGGALVALARRRGEHADA